jgi:hypothetical protein
MDEVTAYLNFIRNEYLLNVGNADNGMGDGSTFWPLETDIQSHE